MHSVLAYSFDATIEFIAYCLQICIGEPKGQIILPFHKYVCLTIFVQVPLAKGRCSMMY